MVRAIGGPEAKTGLADYGRALARDVQLSKSSHKIVAKTKQGTVALDLAAKRIA